MATTGDVGNIAEVMINDTDRERCGSYLYGGFGRDFVTADQQRIMIIGLTPRQWRGIVKATDTGDQIHALELETGLDFSLEADRYIARESLAGILEPWFAARKLTQVQELLERSGVCWGPYQTFREMVDKDPDCSEHNPLFKMIDQPGIGSYLVPRSPINFSAVAAVEHARAPLLGEHSDEILADDLGMSMAEIGRLHDQNIVAGPD
jgi:2-methylfumaryl-CoA isomerase